MRMLGPLLSYQQTSLHKLSMGIGRSTLPRRCANDLDANCWPINAQMRNKGMGCEADKIKSYYEARRAKINGTKNEKIDYN